MKRHKFFETKRLLIRPTTKEDAGFIFELMTSEKWLSNIGSRGLQTEKDALIYIRQKMLPQLERLGFSNYTIIRKTDGAKMGSCGLYDREGLEGIDIGYALLEQYERMGYAFEAASRIKQAAFEDFLFTELYAITTHENISSQRLLEKLGMTWKTSVHISNDPNELRLYQLSVDNISGSEIR
ncbi:GNAT family N-acetyltransferase [Mangrovibacterium sp.]|uniref:GNAT family N-acetyltransferase n=1 Tax=Mangrovibacterium sp. TaxID=1961364 RepID=UPI0035691B7D